MIIECNKLARKKIGNFFFSLFLILPLCVFW